MNLNKASSQAKIPETVTSVLLNHKSLFIVGANETSRRITLLSSAFSLSAYECTYCKIFLSENSPEKP